MSQTPRQRVGSRPRAGASARGWTQRPPVVVTPDPLTPQLPAPPVLASFDASAATVIAPMAGLHLPAGASGSAMEFMLTHLMQTTTAMTGQMSQVATAVAVMQANIQNIDRRSSANENEVRTRLDELERARAADLARLGDLRVDTVDRVAHTREAGSDATQNVVRTQMERTISLAQALLLVGASVMINFVLGLVSSGSVRIGH